MRLNLGIEIGVYKEEVDIQVEFGPEIALICCILLINEFHKHDKSMHVITGLPKAVCALHMRMLPTADLRNYCLFKVRTRSLS